MSVLWAIQKTVENVLCTEHTVQYDRKFKKDMSRKKDWRKMPRKYVIKDQTIYGLYGKNTLPVFIDTSQECADFLGISRDNFIRTAGKIRKGIMHYVRRTYSIALIGKESELEKVK